MFNDQNVQSFPLTTFGGAVPEMAETDLPPGASPRNQDCDFTIGAVRTRPGIFSSMSYAGLTSAKDNLSFADVAIPSEPDAVAWVYYSGYFDPWDVTLGLPVPAGYEVTSATEVTFNTASWAAGSGSGFGANGKDAFGVFLDQDGETAWAFEYFGAGFARFDISDGGIVFQSALFDTPGSTHFLSTREDGTPLFCQNGSDYFAIDNNSVFYKFQVATGTAGNLLNGYCSTPATLDLTTLVPSYSTGYEDIIAFTGADGTNYVALMRYLAPYPGPNAGVLFLIDTDAMSLVATWTPLPTGYNENGWKAFTDSSQNLWMLFADVNLGQAYGTHLIKWASGVTSPGTYALTQATVTTVGSGLNAIQYTGTVTGGASNAYAGCWFTVSGFANNGNNGVFLCYSSTATTITVTATGVNETHAGSAVGTPRLNVTDSGNLESTLVGFASPAKFATYVPSNNSVLLGDFDANLINLDLTAFTVNASNLTSLMYTNTFDAPESAMDVGVQKDGSLAIPTYASSGDGIMSVIDPIKLTVTGSVDLTTGINGQGVADQIPQNSNVPGFSNIRFVSAPAPQCGSPDLKALVAFEYVGSPVYIATLKYVPAITYTSRSQFLQAKNFGFGVPSTSTVYGLQVQVSGTQTYSATITAVTIASNVLTVYCANDYIPGVIVSLSGLTNATFLNGALVTILSATSTYFTASYTHSNWPTGQSGDSDTGSATFNSAGNGSLQISLINPVAGTSPVAFNLASGSFTVGGPMYTFGLGTNLTPTVLNDPNFGFDIQAFSNGGFAFAEVTDVTVTAYISPNPPQSFNYVKTFLQPDGTDLTLALDNGGTFYQEKVQSLPGILSEFYGSIEPGTYAKSVTANFREYIALSDLMQGTDMPRQYDGTFFDRVSQVAPGAAPSVSGTAQGVDVVSITQPSVQSDPDNPGHMEDILWSGTPGNTQPGNVLTLYYKRADTYPNPDPNLVVGGNVALTGFLAINGTAVDGDYIITSVGQGRPPGAEYNRWFFTVATTTAQYFHTGDNNTLRVGYYQVTLATLTTSTQVPAGRGRSATRNRNVPA